MKTARGLSTSRIESMYAIGGRVLKESAITTALFVAGLLALAVLFVSCSMSRDVETPAERDTVEGRELGGLSSTSDDEGVTTTLVADEGSSERLPLVAIQDASEQHDEVTEVSPQISSGADQTRDEVTASLPAPNVETATVSARAVEDTTVAADESSEPNPSESTATSKSVSEAVVEETSNLATTSRETAVDELAEGVVDSSAVPSATVVSTAVTSESQSDEPGARATEDTADSASSPTLIPAVATDDTVAEAQREVTVVAGGDKTGGDGETIDSIQPSSDESTTAEDTLSDAARAVVSTLGESVNAAGDVVASAASIVTFAEEASAESSEDATNTPEAAVVDETSSAEETESQSKPVEAAAEEESTVVDAREVAKPTPDTSVSASEIEENDSSNAFAWTLGGLATLALFFGVVALGRRRRMI